MTPAPFSRCAGVDGRTWGHTPGSSRENRVLGLLLAVVDDDAAAAECGRHGCVIAVGRLVVVDDRARRLVPDLDSELVDAAATGDLAVHRRQQEAVHRRPVVDAAGTLVLGSS